MSCYELCVVVVGIVVVGVVCGELFVDVVVFFEDYW